VIITIISIGKKGDGMSEKEFKFYDNYKPPRHVSKRLNAPADDIDLKAPRRDILGLLESQEVWSSQDAISADEILDELSEWRREGRGRYKDKPTNKTVRNELSNLEESGLVRSRTPSRTKRYWKIPDDEVGSPVWNQVVRQVEQYETHLEGFFLRNGLTLFGVGLYFVGSSILLLAYIAQRSTITVVSSMVWSVGAQTMFAGISVFIVGHIKHRW